MQVMINKKAMSLSILLFVIMTLLLSATSLFVVGTKLNKFSANLQASRSIEGVYAEEQKSEFYLQEVLDSFEIENNNAEETKADFIRKFSSSLKNYKTFMNQSSQVEEQLVDRNLVVRADGVEFNLFLVFERDLSESGKSNIKAVYSVKKLFFKKFNISSP